VRRSLISVFFTLLFLSTMVITFCAAISSSVDIPMEMTSKAEDIENSEEAERPFGESESEDSKSNESKTESDELVSTNESRTSNSSLLSELKYMNQQMVFEMLFLEIPNPPPQG